MRRRWDYIGLEHVQAGVVQVAFVAVVYDVEGSMFGIFPLRKMVRIE